jgi:hypothetical protein
MGMGVGIGNLSAMPMAIGLLTMDLDENRVV